jgi:hypothetical protein
MICEQGFNGTINVKNCTNGVIFTIRIPINYE